MFAIYVVVGGFLLLAFVALLGLQIGTLLQALNAWKRNQIGWALWSLFLSLITFLVLWAIFSAVAKAAITGY